jgi:hypothetical protein
MEFKKIITALFALQFVIISLSVLVPNTAQATTTYLVNNATEYHLQSHQFNIHAYAFTCPTGAYNIEFDLNVQSSNWYGWFFPDDGNNYGASNLRYFSFKVWTISNINGVETFSHSQGAYKTFKLAVNSAHTVAEVFYDGNSKGSYSLNSAEPDPSRISFGGDEGNDDNFYIKNVKVYYESTAATWQPTITSTPIETATLGEYYHYHVTTNESATIELEINPSWLSWNATTATLEGIPDTVQGESVGFAATSENGTLAAHQVFTINVTNQAPIISGTPTDYARVREYYTWTPSADMTVIWSMTPTNGLEIDTASGEIFGIPDSPGTYTLTITATSTEHETTDTMSFSLTVNPGAVVVVEEEPETPTPTPAASGTTIIFGLDMTTLIIIGFIIMAILLIATRRRH